jgi:hypothetical protein
MWKFESDHRGGTEPQESDVTNRNLRFTDSLFATNSLKQGAMLLGWPEGY